MDTNHFTQADRERVIRADEQSKQIVKDIQEIKSLIASSDHERRIREQEKICQTNTEDLQLIKRIVYGGISVILVTLLGVGLKLLLK